MPRCECPPPDGRIIDCPDDHAAFCIEQRDGTFEGMCMEPPAGLSLRQLKNWSLRFILGRENRSLDANISGSEERLLRSGEASVRGRAVRFSLPWLD